MQNINMLKEGAMVSKKTKIVKGKKTLKTDMIEQTSPVASAKISDLTQLKVKNQQTYPAKFNKGMALLIATLCSIAALFVVFMCFFLIRSRDVVVAVWTLIAFVAWSYGKRINMQSEKGISWSPWGYVISIFILREVGVLGFVYDVQKYQAKRRGMDVDGSKGLLFWLVAAVWLSIASVVFMSGYYQAREKSVDVDDITMIDRAHQTKMKSQ